MAPLEPATPRAPQPSHGPTTDLRIAIIGQPNVGKTCIFNRLTGLRQRVGNYPGVTVERKEGRGRLGSTRFTLIDLPGTYSLNAQSLDEHISVRALAGHPDIGPTPDLILCVVDAAKLQRSLLPAFQAASLRRPMVLALNFFDEATAEGWRFDLVKLEERLGIPVIPTVGHRGEGIPPLKDALLRAYHERLTMPSIRWPEPIEQALHVLENRLEYLSDPHIRRFRAQRILFDTAIQGADELDGSPTERSQALAEARRLVQQSGFTPSTAEPVLLHPQIEATLEACVVKSGQASTRLTDRLDAVLVHPVWGLVIFALLMFGIFQAVYAWAGPLMDAIETATGLAQESASILLESTPDLQSLVADGIIAGVGSVVVFLPQILILTLLIALLEDCGYLARAAFLIDRALSWCGLSGKSFVPLMSGFACAIPAIMASRVIEDPRSRLTTILITPFMSCSARLPVYVLMIGAFIEPAYGPTIAAATLFAMHMLGPLLALPIAWLLQTKILKAPAPPFILELPPYRCPTFRDTIWRLWHRARRFLTDAGTIILAMSILIWALLYFPRPESFEEQTRATFIAQQSAETGLPAATIETELDQPDSELAAAFDAHLAGAYVEQSFLGRTGKFLQPIFAPAGFDWKITVSVLASFPAREVVIATLGIIYNLGSDQDEESPGLRGQLARETWPDGPRAGQPVFTVPVAAAIMVFFALCMQCGATIAIMTAETNWRWAWGAFACMTLFGWIGAVLTYQVLSRIL